MSGPTTAAIWSAVAASFAALSSFLIWRVQRRTFIESIRPQLMLANWERRTGKDPFGIEREFIFFREVRNVGTGPALDVSIMPNVYHDPTEPLQTMSSSIHLPIVPAGESERINGRLTLLWEYAFSVKDLKIINSEIAVWCSDSRGVQHEALHRLSIDPLDSSALRIQQNEVTTGVFLWQRQIRRKPKRQPRRRSKQDTGRSKSAFLRPAQWIAARWKGAKKG